MSQAKINEATIKIVELLTSIDSDNRQRIITAALTLLGETKIDSKVKLAESITLPAHSSVHPKVESWMRSYAINWNQLEKVFHFQKDNVEIISHEIPGKGKRGQTINIYILCGIKHLLKSGEAKFDDKEARSLCVSYGCYDMANHSVILSAKGNKFTGAKDKGWELTSPGLAYGADIVKEITKNG